MKKINLKPKTKKIFKSLGISILVIIFLYFIYNIFVYIRTGNQRVSIITNDRYYSNSEVIGKIEVNNYEKQNDKKIKGNAKFRIINDKNKKVSKDIKCKIVDGVTNFEIPVEQLEAGTYMIESIVSTNLGKDKYKTPIYVSNSEKENVTITLDKGIYKPGDDINYRVLLTSEKDDKPIERNVTVNIYDGNSNRVFSKNLQSSDFGIISGDFKLADELNSGTYKLEVETDSMKKSKEFKVNPYTIEKFETKVETDKEEYRTDETMVLSLENTYFYGEPVKNAKTTVTIKSPNNDEKTIEKTTDGNGKIEIKKQLTETGKYNIKVVTIDESNYVVEKDKTIYVKKDAFEIELIPETHKLVRGDNNIYVFAKNIDGTPVKAYINVKGDKSTKKQVATDENGIGVFNINVPRNKVGSFNLEIEAKNDKNEEVKKKFDLDIEIEETLVTTDKVKYNIGEDINISLKNFYEEEGQLLVYKNNQLIKTISLTDTENTKINLEDNYGLIDIGLIGENSREVIGKRTIFIKPDKSLGIELKTDKEEYAPGDKINLQIKTDKEEDTAILVSVLDEAVQSLSDNDLNIDNIKLALSNIKFTDETDAATLYTNIVDDKSEQAIMGLLLKQDNEIKINSKSMTNRKDKMNALKIIKIIIFCAVILIIIITLKKKENIRNILIDIINLIVICAGIASVLLGATNIIFEEVGKGISILAWIIGIVVGGHAYYLLSKDYKGKIIKNIIISAILLKPILYIISEYTEEFVGIVGIIVVLLIILAIEFVIYSKKKNRYQKAANIVLGVIKAVAFAIISSLITLWAFDDIYNFYYDSNLILAINMLTTYLLLNIFMNIFLTKKFKEYKGKSNYKKVLETGKDGAIVISATILIVYVVINVLGGLADKDYDGPIYSPEYKGTTSREPSSIINPSDIVATTTDASNSTQSSGLGGLGDILDFDLPYSRNLDSKEEIESNDNLSAEIQKTESKEQTVRNVFLESMCFIPDKIIENGNSSIDIQTSDNITTWDIQVIGNNKNGDIGYATKNVKVFKDFFVDFDLPNNLKVGDKISIPVTINNYTESQLNANVKIVQADWFRTNTETFNISADSKSNKMEYVTIEIIKAGNNTLRIEANANDFTDIVEKSVEVEPDGYKVSKVVSSGGIDKKESQDVIFDENILDGTNRKTKVKVYSSTLAQTVDGVENMLRMPTGCFEQVSSSLYPDIEILKYLKNTGNEKPEIEKKALEYIEKGYQKLLTYEVTGTIGGYSLYGKAPANVRLTSYGLMQMNEMSEVYNVDERVMENMKNYILGEQKSDGSFGNSIQDTAYITWNLVQSCQDNDKLKKSIEYLKNNWENTKDNYTLSMIANCLADEESKEAKKIIDKVIENESENYDSKSNMYGTRGKYLSTETKAILSIAMTKLNYKDEYNQKYINDILDQKDAKGNWHNTQTTAIVLRAINNMNNKQKMKDNKITIIMNGNEEVIEVGDSGLDVIQKEYDNLGKENKLEIISKNGGVSYEIINEYYIPYENVKELDSGIEVKTEFTGSMKVTEEIKQKIKITNTSKNKIQNGQIRVQIPQGCKMDEKQLEKLKLDGIIDKYEMNYRELYMYIENFEKSGYKEFEIGYRLQYPIEVKTGEVEVYDYYNPDTKGIALPQKIGQV